MQEVDAYTYKRMYQEFSNMPIPDLVDLLAHETELFTHLLNGKQFGKEYDASKKKIHALTAAITDHKDYKPKKSFTPNDPSS